MAQQSPLRTIKRWQRYVLKDNWRQVERGLRGLYVLYNRKTDKSYEVVYIGIAGVRKSGGSIRGRLSSHAKSKDGWSHFSFFEVHDNITNEEIRELESLLLGIFRHDPRI